MTAFRFNSTILNNFRYSHYVCDIRLLYKHGDEDCLLSEINLFLPSLSIRHGGLVVTVLP